MASDMCELGRKGSVLVVDDDLAARQSLEGLLGSRGYEVRCAPSGFTALMFAQEELPDLVLLDVRLPDVDGLEVCRRLKTDPRTMRTPVIFLSALKETEEKVKGFAAGGVDYIGKPIQVDEVLARVEAHVTLHGLRLDLERRVEARTEELQARLREIEALKQQLEQENIYLREEVKQLFAHEEIVGQSDAMRRVLAQVEQVAPTDSTVLIAGETGVGKELIARAIHNLSRRKDRALVTVNCAALPSSLIESELFGREKGAYTGAMTMMKGRFEVADGSTLFLDEIGELPLEVQAKLLRALEEGRLERLGSAMTLQVDVRIIAASNRDLEHDVQEGTFRRDLYYRLNVFPIAVPPLRDRGDDIPLLVWAFVQEFEKKMGKRIESIPKRAMDALRRYPWPGNARELRNVIEHAMIVSGGKSLSVRIPAVRSVGLALSPALEDVEREHVLSVLEQTGWRVAGLGGAAARLGLKRTTLQSRMKKLGIKRPAS